LDTTKTNNTDNAIVSKPKKTLIKKWWFWLIIIVCIITIIASIFFFINKDVKPKLDENGKPIFIELTDEVYTNANNYLGYHINIKGKVFQVLGDTGESKGVQVWLDPETSEQNIWIYYSNAAEIKQGDFIVCSGYIKDVTSYDNNYGAELSAPLVISNDMRKANYIEVMSPTISSHEFLNVSAEQHKYSISVNKVEFANDETRIYFSAKNQGKAKMYTGVSDAVILQSGKQYNASENYDAEYETIPYELYVGVESSGIVTFSKIEQKDFQIIVEIHSDDVDEEFEAFVFNISPEKNSGTVEPIKPKEPATSEETTTKVQKPSKPSYTSIVGTYQGLEINMGNVTATFYRDGTLYITTSESESFTGIWSQTKNQVHFTLIDSTGFEWTPQDVTVSSRGIDGLWGEFFSRV
jgi:hypothetical protein